MDENGGSFMGKSKDILCFSWLLLCLFCTLRRVKLWFFCSAYFVRFNKCWLVQKESDHIVVSVSISSPKHVVLTWIEPSPCFIFFFSLSMVCFIVHNNAKEKTYCCLCFIATLTNMQTKSMQCVQALKLV